MICNMANVIKSRGFRMSVLKPFGLLLTAIFYFNETSCRKVRYLSYLFNNIVNICLK
jgi:hypothetical protein